MIGYYHPLLVYAAGGSKVAALYCPTLQKAKFHLKTSLGTSAATYQHCDVLGTESSYKVHWIKSRQDNQRPTSTLSLAARLNCEADKLAGDYQSAFYRRRNVVPMIEGTCAQMLIDGVTINGNYKHAIRDAISLPPYDQYLEPRFGWDIIVWQAIESIEWESFTRIIGSFRTHQATTVKHLHGIAPTGKICSSI